jgi:hypothetical protein
LVDMAMWARYGWTGSLARRPLYARYPACSRSSAGARFPPNCAAHGRPLDVDSGRIRASRLRTNGGQSPKARRTSQIDPNATFKTDCDRSERARRRSCSMAKAAPIAGLRERSRREPSKTEAIVIQTAAVEAVVQLRLIHASFHGGIDPKKMDVHTAMGLPMIGHW